MPVTYEDILRLTQPITPYKWVKHNLTVVGDGYTEEGVRIHIVAESGYKLPNFAMLSNAIVVSEDLDYFGK